VQTVVGRVLSDVTLVYVLLLVVRAIVETVLSLNRDFRPSGAAAAFFEFVYTVTDPPLSALRRLIPPLRVGSVALDLAFTVLVLGLLIIRGTVFSSI